MAKGKDRMVRTTITLPLSLKERMSGVDTNWSEELREMIGQRLEEQEGGRPDMAEAVILNEELKRPAPKGWDSLQAIKQWRRQGKGSS